jgi:hypothetical protein
MSKEKYYLFLDDIRNPEDVTWVSLPKVEWTIVRSYKEFTTIIKKKGIPKFVAFDHDLSVYHYDNYHGIDAAGRVIIDYSRFEEKTGYECAKFLVDRCIKKKVKFPEYVVHSMNPVGAKNIISYVESYNKSV